MVSTLTAGFSSLLLLDFPITESMKSSMSEADNSEEESPFLGLALVFLRFPEVDFGLQASRSHIVSMITSCN